MPRLCIFHMLDTLGAEKGVLGSLPGEIALFATFTPHATPHCAAARFRNAKMIVLVGCFVVIGAVIAGFTIAGGHLGALVQFPELITIGGSALGALIVMSPEEGVDRSGPRTGAMREGINLRQTFL